MGQDGTSMDEEYLWRKAIRASVPVWGVVGRIETMKDDSDIVVILLLWVAAIVLFGVVLFQG